MATRRVGTTAGERDSHTGQAHHKYGVRASAHPARIYPVSCPGKGKRLTARRPRREGRGTTDRYAQDGELKAWYYESPRCGTRLILCNVFFICSAGCAAPCTGNNHDILKKHCMVGTACAWNSFHASVVFVHTERLLVYSGTRFKGWWLALAKSRCPPP
jgi:hypothetical protein